MTYSNSCSNVGSRSMSEFEPLFENLWISNTRLVERIRSSTPVLTYCTEQLQVALMTPLSIPEENANPSLPITAFYPQAGADQWDQSVSRSERSSDTGTWMSSGNKELSSVDRTNSLPIQRFVIERTYNVILINFFFLLFFTRHCLLLYGKLRPFCARV